MRAQGCVLLLAVLLSACKEDENAKSYRVMVRGNEMSAYDLSVREQLGHPIVKVSFAISRLGSGGTRLTSEYFQTLCGAFLTDVLRKTELDLSRNDIARVEVNVKLSEESEKDSLSLPITVTDGSCAAPDRKGLYYVGLMPPNAGWQVTDFKKNLDSSEIEYVLQPLAGEDYASLKESFEPRQACLSILKEEFSVSDLFDWPDAETESLKISIKNVRGNSIAFFSTGRSWVFDVAGDVCFQDEGFEG